MKARIPLSKDIRKAIEEEIKSRYQKELNNNSEAFERRILKLICYSLHEDFGFGGQRCKTLLNSVAKNLEKTSTDEVFWEHIDRTVIDKMKIDFDRDYTKNGKPATERRVD